VVYTLFIRFDLSDLPDLESREYLRDNLKFLIDDKEVDPEFDNERNRPPIRGTMLQATYRNSGDVFFFNPDLSRLPFDRPVIKLKFEINSVEDKSRKMMFRFNCLVKDPFLGNVGQITFRDNSDRVPEYNFAILETSIERPVTMKQTPYSTDKYDVYAYYPTTTVNIRCFREPEYLIFSIVVPLILINLFTLTIFLLDSSDLGTKLGILVTIILALFAFTFSVRQSLPSVPYLTDLEKQIVLSLIVMFISAIETIVGYLSSEPVGYVTKWVTGILASILVVTTLIVFSIQYIFYRRECNHYDLQNEIFLRREKTKDSGQTSFKFTDCVGPGRVLTSERVKLAKNPLLHSDPSHKK